jgi:hypothetical protein
MGNVYFYKPVKIFSCLAATTIMLFFMINMVTAQTIDENLPQTSTISSIGAGGSKFYGQSFYANVYKITKFGAYLREISPEGEIILAIVPADGSGNPDVNTVLYQSSLINPTTTGTWFYDTGLNINVTPGNKYFVLYDGYNNVGASGTSEVGVSNLYTDTGEGIKYSNDAGSTWTHMSAYPLAIYVEGILPPPVPFSTWSILAAFLVIGIASFIGIRRFRKVKS